MKITKEMGNAAMQAAIDSGLIKDGVTYQQRQQLDKVVQAALDAHPTLKVMEELRFVGTDPQAFAAVSSDTADAVLSNSNTKVFMQLNA